MQYQAIKILAPTQASPANRILPQDPTTRHSADKEPERAVSHINYLVSATKTPSQSGPGGVSARPRTRRSYMSNSVVNSNLSHRDRHAAIMLDAPLQSCLR